MSFVGSYTHSIDSKKRVFVPSKFREELGEEFAGVTVHSPVDQRVAMEKAKMSGEEPVHTSRRFVPETHQE